MERGMKVRRRRKEGKGLRRVRHESSLFWRKEKRMKPKRTQKRKGESAHPFHCPAVLNVYVFFSSSLYRNFLTQEGKSRRSWMKAERENGNDEERNERRERESRSKFPEGKRRESIIRSKTRRDTHTHKLSWFLSASHRTEQNQKGKTEKDILTSHTQLKQWPDRPTCTTSSLPHSSDFSISPSILLLLTPSSSSSSFCNDNNNNRRRKRRKNKKKWCFFGCNFKEEEKKKEPFEKRKLEQV